VERQVQAGGRPAEADATQRAELIATAVLGFDLYRWQSRCFAVPEGEPFDADRLRAGTYDRFLVGHTVRDVQDEIVQRTRTQMPRVLLLANRSASAAECLVARLGAMHISVLSDVNLPRLSGSVDVIRHDVDLSAVAPTPEWSRLVAEVRAREFDLVAIPYDRREGPWMGPGLEQFAASVCDRLLVLFADGGQRIYRGEDIRRFQYNKAYFNSMFRGLPPVTGKRVLEVGASDGLACDLMTVEEPEHVVGVDVVDIVGCGYPHPSVSYLKIDDALPFDDDSFDLTFSIATLEHISDPIAAIQEMIRVTRPGGYCYVQAGPLYCSPYGHHMFGHFDDVPWIHLRMSADEIVAEACRRRLDETFQRERRESVAEYVRNMLDVRHVNGRMWDEYGLDSLMRDPAARVVDLRRSYEGEDLITPQILCDVYPIDRRDLVAHGFELVLEKRS
jgi:SAM-dependent methyltransferase